MPPKFTTTHTRQISDDRGSIRSTATVVKTLGSHSPNNEVDDLDNFMDNFDAQAEVKKQHSNSASSPKSANRLDSFSIRSSSAAQPFAPDEIDVDEDVTVDSGRGSPDELGNSSSVLSPGEISTAMIHSNLATPQNATSSSAKPRVNTSPAPVKNDSPPSNKPPLKPVPLDISNTTTSADSNGHTTTTSNGFASSTTEPPPALERKESVTFKFEDMGHDVTASMQSRGFDDEHPSLIDTQAMSGSSGVNNNRSRVSTTFGESTMEDDYGIEWCTGERTVYCSSRCHCFVQVLAMHQQVDCNITAASAAKYLENLCEDCKTKTALALVSVRRFLRCVTFIQLKFHWRYTYRRIVMERNRFLGGVPRSTFSSQCCGTKGRCVRCEPFLDMMRTELIGGLRRLNGDSAESSMSATPSAATPVNGSIAGSIALSRIRVRRRAQGTVEERKKLVERALRLTYFLCNRCKTISKTMIKQAAVGKLK